MTCMTEFKIGLSTGPSVLECSHLEKGKDVGGTHKGECVPIGKFLIQAVLSCDIVNVCDSNGCWEKWPGSGCLRP